MGWLERWNAKRAARRAAKAAVKRREREKAKSKREGVRTEGERTEVERIEGGPGVGADVVQKFEKDMEHEGYKLTDRGENVKKIITDAYMPHNPRCWEKAMMGFFGGDNCQSGIFWVRTERFRFRKEPKPKKEPESGAESFRFHSETTHYDPRTRA